MLPLWFHRAAALVVLLVVTFSSPARAWTWRAPSAPTGGNTIFGAAYAPELDTVIAVDMGGSVLRKTGNDPWIATSVPDLIGFEAAHWTGQHFIISGAYPDEDDYDEWHGISRDGINWQPIDALRDNGLYGFASSPQATVALDGATVWVSSDAARAVWVEKKLPLIRNTYGRPDSFDFIAYSNGTFVVVNREGYAATSRDGVSWALSPVRYDGYVDQFACSNGLFVTGGYGTDAKGNAIYELRTSTDGKSWRLRALPEADYWVTTIMPTGSGFLLLGQETSYVTSDFENWSPLDWGGANAQTGWVQCSAPAGARGAYLFGSGGRIGNLSPLGDLQTIVDPGGPAGDPCSGWLSQPFRFLAAAGSILFGATEFADSYNGGSYYLGPEGRWVEFTGGLDEDSQAYPVSFHQLDDSVVAVAGWPRSIYEYDGTSWRLLGPAPDPKGDWDIVSVARSPAGRVGVLLRSQWSEALRDQRDYDVYFSDDWRSWISSRLGSPLRGYFLGGPTWNGVDDSIRYDGQRFLVIVEPGRLFVVEPATWTPIPAPPNDTVAFRKKYYGAKSKVALVNEPRSFASNGDVLVAGSTKVTYKPATDYLDVSTWDALDQFFVYSFSNRTWSSVVPPGARLNSRHTPILRWNGSIFIAAMRDGTCLSADFEGGYVYTSPDGYKWTRREFPVGGNLLDLLWTGAEFAGVTSGSSVVTDPTGLSRELPPPPQPDKITFTRIPSKVFGAAPFALRAKAKTGRSLVFTSSDENVAVVDGSGRVTVRGAGSTMITAKVAEDSSVGSKQQVLAVKPLRQKFSLKARPSQKFGFPFEVAVRGNSATPLIFASEPPGAISVVSAGGSYRATANITGTIKLTVTQPGDNNRLAARPVTRTFRIE